MKITPSKISLLKEKGFSGLYLPGECGCSFDDVAPCGEENVPCKPGYLGKDGWVSGNKEAAETASNTYPDTVYYENLVFGNEESFCNTFIKKPIMYGLTNIWLNSNSVKFHCVLDTKKDVGQHCSYEIPKDEFLEWAKNHASP